MTGKVIRIKFSIPSSYIDYFFLEYPYTISNRLFGIKFILICHISKGVVQCFLKATWFCLTLDQTKNIVVGQSIWQVLA